MKCYPGEELELIRSYNCLTNANTQTIGDLVQKTEAEMLRTKDTPGGGNKFKRERRRTQGLAEGPL